MSTAPLADPPGAAPGVSPPGDGRRGRLLGLVRQLLAFGRDLVATLQRQNTPTPAEPLARRFRSFNLAIIVARITHGLRLAAALETRLLRTPPIQERMPGTRPIRRRAAGRPQGHPGGEGGPGDGDPAKPARPRDTRAAAAMRNGDWPRTPPTAEEIAAAIRGRPAGAVIVEICRHLGIDTTHPLWPQINDAIIQYGGSLSRMVASWFEGLGEFLAAIPPDRPAAPPPSWDGPCAAATGPP